MRVLHLDCFSGIAGDMLVGALLDLGAPFDVVRDGLARLALEPYELDVRSVRRGAVRATKFEVRIAGAAADSPEHTARQIAARAAHDHPHDHEHEHEHEHEQPHGHGAHAPERGLREIRALLEPADLPGRVRARALAAFTRLAEAEGRVHGRPADEVHFHEVGAVDAVCDIVGAALALEALGIDAVSVGPLHVGSGFVDCAHGRLPVPAPATLECLAGFEIVDDGRRGELVTPTGACLVASLATPGLPRGFTVGRVGYGAGTRDPRGVPNVLRAVLGTVAGAPDGADDCVELRANVDHLPPNVLAAALDRVRAAGAVEVFTVPCTMKKGRAGHLVTALAPEATWRAVEETLLRETGTLGVRRTRVERTVLARETESVATPWGPVRVKVGRFGGAVTSREPEFEDCRALAERHGVPVADVFAAARRG